METTLNITGEMGASKLITLPAGCEVSQESPYYYHRTHMVDGVFVTEEFGFRTHFELMEFLAIDEVVKISKDYLDDLRGRNCSP